MRSFLQAWRLLQRSNVELLQVVSRFEQDDQLSSLRVKSGKVLQFALQNCGLQVSVLSSLHMSALLRVCEFEKRTSALFMQVHDDFTQACQRFVIN